MFPETNLDPANNLVDRVRIHAGDIDECEVELSNDLYQYFLDSNDQDVGLAAIQALKALVAKYANGMNTVEGDVEENFRQRFEGYKELLDKFTKDPTYSLLGAITPYAGGLSKTERLNDCNDPDLRVSEFYAGSANSRSRLDFYY